MKEFTYKPNSEGFEGEIKLKVPSFKERLEITQQLGFKLDANGEVDAASSMNMMGQLLEKMETLVTSVSLKYGDVEFNSLDDLSYYKEGQAIINEVIAVLMNGMTLGKN